MDHNPYSAGEQPALSEPGPQGPKFEASIRTMQIIAAALVMGVLMFFGVVLVSTQGDVLGMNNPTFITAIAAGFGFLMIVNHFVIPGIIVRGQLRQAASRGLREQDDGTRNQQVLGIFQTQLIIGLALLEGGAFFNLIALMIGKSGFSLGVVILLLILMLMKFPTRDKVSFWVQDKLREMQLL